MRSRPNARQMSSDETASSLFLDEEQAKSMQAVRERRSAVPRTQMGTPQLRAKVENRRPALEWTKAIFICVALISGFLTFTWSRRSRHIQRKSSNFGTLDRCDITTYPLWQIEKLEELNLGGCDNVNLHGADWSRFKALKKLDLNNNSLIELPDEMEVLSSLEILFLSDNKIETMPAVIGKLKSLRVLSLKGNALNELSSANLPVSSLIWLILTNNKISTIDPSIGEVKLLRKLMLSHNDIETIPVELEQCKDLELVRLADNKLKSVPKEVLALPKLAWISLSGNPMSKPPKSVDKIIKESELEMNKSKALGKGASGTVYPAKYNGKDVAVKIFKGGSKGSDGNAADEAAINGIIDHPLAVAAIGVIPLEEGKDGGYKGMVMDLLRGVSSMGTVPSFDTVTRDEGPAQHSKGLIKEQVYSAVFNIATVLDYIHSHASVGVAHGDIYLHNILRDGTQTARLSDWGASYVYDHDSESAGMYEGIEVLAFGRLVQDLFDWHLNTALPDSTESTPNLRSTNRRNIDEGSPFAELMASILQPDQTSRPNFHTIKEKLESMEDFKEFQSQQSH